MNSLSATESPPAFNWHPKITPYRLAFIAITIGLGITKAVLVSHGQVDPPITVEWVAGVPVALSLQFLNAYEYKVHRSIYIDWVFSYDCLNIPKLVIRYTRTRDSASGGPNGPALPGQPNDQENRPQIATAYRLLVSASVAIFGVAKMLCAYLGLPTVMNTFDWVVAIPLTLGLYYVGLYEDNRSSIPRKLFDVDYSSEAKALFRRVGRVLVFCICISPYPFWIKLCREVLLETLNNGELAPKTPNILEFMDTLTSKMVMIALWVMMIVLGNLYICIILWPVIRKCSEKHANPIYKYGVQVFALTLSACFFIFYLFLFLLFLVAGLGRYFQSPDIDNIPTSMPGIIMMVLFSGTAVCITIVKFTSFFGWLQSLLS